MLATELGLIASGLIIAYLSRAHRRNIFHLAILLFLVAFFYGSITLVIGGVAILGLGMINAAIAHDDRLRRQVFAATGGLLLAAVTLPVLQSTSRSTATNEETPLAMSQSPLNRDLTNRDLLEDLAQIDPMALLAENREAVDAVAKDLLGRFRQRAIDVAKQNDGAEISTTIDFKAPAQLLSMNLLEPAQSSDAVAQADKSGQFKFHASLSDATTCNQCHDVGGQPLHASIRYELGFDQEIKLQPDDDAPDSSEPQPEPLLLDPDLFVHGN